MSHRFVLLRVEDECALLDELRRLMREFQLMLSDIGVNIGDFQAFEDELQSCIPLVILPPQIPFERPNA